MRRSQTLNYCLCFFITGLPLGALGPSLPIVVESFGVDIETVGITFSVFFSGYLFGALISAVLIQRIAGHRLLALGLFVLMLTFLAAPWAANLWALWLIWGLLGVSVGSLQATLNTLLIWVHKDKVAPHMNAAHFSFGLGALLTPLLIIQSINFTGSINGVYWFSGIIAGVMMLRLLYLTSPKIPTVSRHITTTSRKNYPSIVSVVALLFVYVGAETSFAGWMPTYAIRQGIVEVTTAAYFSSVFWAALTLGRLLWIPYTKRMSPDRIVIISLLGCIVSMIIVYNFGKTVTILGLGIVMMGLSMSSVFPSALCSLERRVHMTGYINSLCLVSAALGGMFFPWLLGYAF